jgi:hypothetical protein
MRSFWKFMTVVIVPVSLAGCMAAPGPPMPPGASFSLAGPCIISKPGSPRLVFTTVNRQDGSRDYVYVLVIKPPEPQNNMAQQTSSSESNASGLVGIAKTKMTINGKALTVDYKMTVRPDNSLESEVLEINGKSQALGSGRVFLVDLSNTPMTVVPHEVKLSTPAAGLTNPMAIEKQAEKTLADLEQDSAVAEFVQGAK